MKCSAAVTRLGPVPHAPSCPADGGVAGRTPRPGGRPGGRPVRTQPGACGYLAVPRQYQAGTEGTPPADAPGGVRSARTRNAKTSFCPGALIGPNASFCREHVRYNLVNITQRYLHNPSILRTIFGFPTTFGSQIPADRNNFFVFGVVVFLDESDSCRGAEGRGRGSSAGGEMSVAEVRR